MSAGRPLGAEQLANKVRVCELTLSNGIFNDLNGLVELSNLNLDWVGPHLGLLGRGQRSDCKQLKIKGSHAEECISIGVSKWKSEKESARSQLLLSAFVISFDDLFLHSVHFKQTT